MMSIVQLDLRGKEWMTSVAQACELQVKMFKEAARTAGQRYSTW